MTQNLYFLLKVFTGAGGKGVYFQPWVKINLLLKTEDCTLQDREIIDLSYKSIN